MIEYRCDGCGRKMEKHALRYRVTVDVRAAYDEIEIGLADLVRDHRQEMIDLIKRMEKQDPKEVEAQVYKRLSLDLCPECQRSYIKDPIHFHPEAAGDAGPVDIDAFLRSLGFGKGARGDG